jgi:hypothetical protein
MGVLAPPRFCEVVRVGAAGGVSSAWCGVAVVSSAARRGAATITKREEQGVGAGCSTVWSRCARAGEALALPRFWRVVQGVEPGQVGVGHTPRGQGAAGLQ